MTALVAFLFVLSVLCIFEPLWEPWMTRHDVWSRLRDEWDREISDDELDVWRREP